MAIVGVCGLTILPAGLELGCELTRDANASSAILWFSYVEIIINVRDNILNTVDSGNLFVIIFVLGESPRSFIWLDTGLIKTCAVEGALTAGPEANPPYNMRRALVFNGAFVMACASLIFLLRGQQRRKERDEQKYQDLVQLEEMKV